MINNLHSQKFNDPTQYDGTLMSRYLINKFIVIQCNHDLERKRVNIMFIRSSVATETELHWIVPDIYMNVEIRYIFLVFYQ